MATSIVLIEDNSASVGLVTYQALYRKGDLGAIVTIDRRDDKVISDSSFSYGTGLSSILAVATWIDYRAALTLWICDHSDNAESVRPSYIPRIELGPNLAAYLNA